VTRPRHSSELLTKVLSLVACLSFVLGLQDARLRPAPANKSLEVLQITEQVRSASVRVRVALEGGAALPSATVQVFWERAGSFHWLLAESTDGAGQALLEHLPEGRVWLLAEAPGFARASSTLILGAELRTVGITLQPAQALDVTVLDEASVPIGGATVLADTSDPLPFGALSDAQGVAHFSRLCAPPWSVKASVPGYESVSRAGVRGAITLNLRRLASLEVTVLAASGAPAAGATVLIAGPSLWPARSTVANAAGVARITGLLAGSYDLRGSLGEDVAPTVFGLAIARGANEKLSLQLEPGRTVVALVTDGEGASPLVVANADVVLAEGGLSSFPIRGRTGGDGKVSLGPIAAGPATLGARAADFVGSALVAVPEVLTGPVQVPLTRGATLRGEVVDANGYPIEGASIEVVGSESSGSPIAETPALVSFRQNHFSWSLPGPVPLVPAGELGVMPGPVPPIPKPGGEPALATNSADFEQPLVEISPWISNRGGLFTARPITPGRVRAIVRHPDYVEGESELVSVSPGGEARVRIVLLRGGSVEGRVKDERGEPVPGVEVLLSSALATRTERATTASDGSFAFAAVPADITLSMARAEDPARVVLRKSVHVAEGAHEKLELTLPQARDAVRVLVQDEEGRPIELAEVAMTSLEATRPLRLTRFTSPEGAASFEDAAGENVRVVAEAPGFARHSETVPVAPKELKLSLKRGVLVAGRITAVRGRQAVAGALVTLQQNGVRKSATTDAEGGFQLRDVAPGPLRVHVEHADFADEEVTLQVEATGRADRPFSLPDIDLAEPGEVEGEVRDGRGDPVLGARVTVGDAPSYVPAGRALRGVVLSDRDGHFLLPRVHPGTVTISAVSSVAGRGSVRGVEVSAGRTTRNLRLELTSQPTEAETLATGSVAVALGERGNAPAIAVVVVSVAEASEAERAGVEAGDVITAVDGVRPTSMHDARARLSGQPGSDVLLEVSRGSTQTRFRVLREATLAPPITRRWR